MVRETVIRVLLKDNVLVLVPETAAENAEIAAWKSSRGDHVFCLRSSEGSNVEFRQLGPRLEVCREPLNVVSNSVDPIARIISNFAATPFELDSRRYRSVESFWQGLKFSDENDRRRLADLDGPQARSEGDKHGYGATVNYGGEDIVVGTSAHWRLMERACCAKFEQNAEARAALLSTGERPLQHVVRRDSTTIPGVIMAQIWMRIRKHLRKSQLQSSRTDPC
jgi:predicted NAD-dependent protein-ADP-ribosyltransferase YbiA (DUF1768 family)